MRLFERITQNDGSVIGTAFLVIDDVDRTWESFNGNVWFLLAHAIYNYDLKVYFKEHMDGDLFKELKKQSWRFVSPIGQSGVGDIINSSYGIYGYYRSLILRTV